MHLLPNLLISFVADYHPDYQDGFSSAFTN